MGYRADATKVGVGSIVQVRRPLDSTGTATHTHSFVVVGCKRPIEVGGVVGLVGVSSSVAAGSFDPARHIPMKWMGIRGGDPETGLTKPCYACVDFFVSMRVYAGQDFPLELAVEYRGHFVRSDKLQTIVAALNAWSRRKAQSHGDK